jgi:NAD+ kinase
MTAGRGFGTVGVVAHPHRDCAEVFAAVRDWAGTREIELLARNDDSPLSRLGEPVPDGEFASRVGLVIAAGGDGTILRALAIAAPERVPVLGVNVGRLGFLAEVDPLQLPAALTKLTDGNFTVEERLALVGRSPSIDAPIRASNDLVLGRVPGQGQAEFSASIDGELFTRYVGDGLIVSTPTGSTAYSLSAGGPIVSPVTEALIVTAIAPHGVFDRSLVVAPSERLQIELLGSSARVVIECDGWHRGELGPGDVLAVAPSDRPGLLVRFEGPAFYGRARTKLQLVDPLVLGSQDPA